MMALTHAAIAAAGVSFALNDASWLTLQLAVIGSQLPDIDTSESWIGQILFPISRWLEDRFPHRTVTHSLVATAAIAGVSVPIYIFLGWKFWLALWLGHLLACFSDTFTKQGVQLFWPQPVWCVCGSNPNKRMTTGGTGEYWVLAGAIAVLMFSLSVNNSGGLLQTASQALGRKDGALKTYNAEANTHLVWADISAVRASDRKAVNGRYFILGTENDEFIVSDGQGIYKTTEQLVTNRVNTVVGNLAQTRIETLSFNDEPVLPKLQQLRTAYPGAAVYVSGQVVIDVPEDIQIPLIPDQLQTVKLAGNTVTLKFHPVDLALTQLIDQYATGMMTAKVVNPNPYGR